jgi:hypothetical protein
VFRIGGFSQLINHCYFILLDISYIIFNCGECHTVFVFHCLSLHPPPTHTHTIWLQVCDTGSVRNVTYSPSRHSKRCSLAICCKRVWDTFCHSVLKVELESGFIVSEWTVVNGKWTEVVFVNHLWTVCVAYVIVTVETFEYEQKFNRAQQMMKAGTK